MPRRRLRPPVLALAALASTHLPAQLHRPAAPQAPAAGPKRTLSEETGNSAAPAATNGTIVANFTIKLATPVPSGYEVLCNLYASVTEDSSSYTLNNEIDDAASAKATVSGSTATCSVKLPYEWYLATPTSDTAQLTYYLYIFNASGTNPVTEELRTSSQYVPGAGAIKIPANNSTTTYSIAATL